jgi:hypothetical protein
METTKLREWLENGGAEGLSCLQLEDFPDTGRGVKTLRPLKSGDIVLTIPGSFLWTADAAFDDPIFGPTLSSVKPPLSVEDTLAVFLLFIKSREEGYEGRREHVKLLPTSYTTSVFFTDEELEICSGSSIYHITKQLKQQIREDYLQLLTNLFSKHPDFFPLEKFTQDDVSFFIRSLIHNKINTLNFMPFSICGLFAQSGVVLWISNYLASNFDVLHLLPTC